MAWIKLFLAATLCSLSLTAAAQNAANCCMHDVQAPDPTACAVSQPASQSRPVTGIYSLEFGGTHDLSTYLSPLFYDGTDFTLSGIWTKDFQRWSDRCVMRFEGDISFRLSENPVKSATMYGLTAHFGWGMSWRHRFLKHWQVTIGPMLDIFGGAMYLARNGNNPVNAMAYAGLDIAASLSYKFKMGRIACRLVDEVRVPTVGGFFCPGYGETYYEIYLGNHKNLAHFGWWGNSMGVNNLLSLRMKLGRTGMMIGYRLDLRTFHANNLKTQQLRNAFVIGIIP